MTMTREEAIKILKSKMDGSVDNSYEWAETVRMAIEALSQPIVDITQRDLCADISCEDCPFMQETCKLMDYVAYADRPHGEWIRRDNYKVMGEGYIWHCSICDEKVYQDSSRDYPHENFCPSCGADMRKETE